MLAPIRDVLPERIQGPLVAVRTPCPGELETMAHLIAEDAQASPWWGTDVEVVRRDLLADPDYIVLVIEHDGEPVGVIAFEEEPTPEYFSAGIDITLLECCTDRGLGTEALRLLIAWLIDERGHHRLTIDPATANERAIRAYASVGFRPIGVARQYDRAPDGSWRDALLMDLLAEEFVRTPRTAVDEVESHA